MKLLIITHDFPYGTAETFLETEIKYAAKHFDTVNVLSMSQASEITRKVPSNVIVLKATRKYKLIRCILYAIFHLFSKQVFVELKTTSNHFPLIQRLKSCLKSLMIEHRLFLKAKEEGIVGDDYIAYSYWLAEGAFFITSHKDLWGKVIARAHSYELWDTRYQPFIKNTIRRLDDIYSISLSTSRLVNNKIGSYISKLSRLGIESKTQDFVKKKKDEFLIVSCSSIYNLKRLDLIVDSISKITNKNRIKINWIHLGGGSDEEQIRKLCEKKLDNIIWSITGWISNSEVIEFYRTHYVDLFINMSDMEGIPVSIMEAISNGIPCLARNVGGNSEIVNEITGYLFQEKCTSDDVAMVIDSIIDGTIQFNRNAIIDYFHSNYSASTNYDRFYYMLKQNDGGKNHGVTNTNS